MSPAVDYTAKTLFTGYKLGLKTPTVFVGIPEKYWDRDQINVRVGETIKAFRQRQIKHRQIFNDKFVPGATYALVYVPWHRVRKGALNGQAN